MLITGHKGFVGRNLVAHLYSTHQPFYVVYNEPYAFNCKTLIHLSSFTNVRASIADPVKCFNKNVFQTLKMLNFAKNNSFKRFIFASSCSASLPLSPYAASKSASEALCTAFSNSYGLKTSIIRFANIYGPCSEFKKGLITNFINAAINDTPFYIFGDGSQTRSFIHVSDVVNALLNPLDNLSTVSSDQLVSVNNVVKILSSISYELLGRTPEILYSEKIEGEIDRPKFEQSNYELKVNLKEGLFKTFEWFLRRKGI